MYGKLDSNVIVWVDICDYFQWALMEADGSPLHGVRRQVTINRVVKTRSGYTRSDPERKLIVRDDGIVQYDFTTEDDAEMITIRVNFHSDLHSFLLSLFKSILYFHLFQEPLAILNSMLQRNLPY